jgi:hypothetical protein
MSTPAADGDRVYAYFGSAGLFAFDFDGKPVWSYPLPLPKMRYGRGDVAHHRWRSHSAESRRARGRFWWRWIGKTARSFGKIVNPTGQGGAEGRAMPHQSFWKGHVVLHRSGEVVGHSLQDGK